MSLSSKYDIQIRWDDGKSHIILGNLTGTENNVCGVGVGMKRNVVEPCGNVLLCCTSCMS